MDHTPWLLAAIDLGSNSFRLEVQRHTPGQPALERVHYSKEVLRLGAGLDADGYLTPNAMQRGWDCIERFGQELRHIAPHAVRAVATQTLREARNRDTFMQRASQLLGYPIELIDGQEEARLIYQGVSQLLPASDERRLVIDVGGRSTEIMLGQGHQATYLSSVALGSVSWSQRFFADGVLSRAAFAAAQAAASAVLQPIAQSWPQAAAAAQNKPWQQAYGASGSAAALGTILHASGHPPGCISRAGLDGIYAQLLQAGHIDRVQLPALQADRRPVMGGGVAVMRALFDLFDIQQMQLTQGALRQGLLHDLLTEKNKLQQQVTSPEPIKAHSYDRYLL